MESGNSSSMQSSSGGGDEQEYESSGATATAAGNYFLHNTTNPQFHSTMQQQQQYMFSPNPQPSSQHQTNYLDTFGDQSSYQNLMFWQQQQQQQQHLGGLSSNHQLPFTATSCTTGASTHPALPPSANFGTGSSAAASSSQQQAVNFDSLKPSDGAGAGGGASGSGQKNPRKRTRASRRAPTTVLTTDTSNFRAMVQEFTGIPSSPFSGAASPLLSRRLTDLFAGSSAPGGSSLRPGGVGGGVGVGVGNSNLERLLAGYNTSYPFRPAAQKPPLTSLAPPSSSTNPTTSLLMNINTSTNTATNAALNLPDSIINNSNNSNLPFQSLMQSGATSSSLRYSPAGLLSGSGTNFQDLGGMIGNEQMFMTSNDPSMGGGGFPPMRLASDSGGGGGGGGGWKDGSSGGGSSVPCNDHGGGNIGALSHEQAMNNAGADRNNNDSNQHMEGSIGGSGTTNYHHHVNVNVNMNCSRDKGLDNTAPSRVSGGQGTLGHFLD